MERVDGRLEKMEGYCSTGQSPQWAVVPMEEDEEEYMTLINLEQCYSDPVVDTGLTNTTG